MGSKLSAAQIQSLIAQGFRPLETVMLLPKTGFLAVVEIEGEKWATRSMGREHVTLQWQGVFPDDEQAKGGEK